MNRSRLACAFATGLVALASAASGQLSPRASGVFQSASGQFVISAAPNTVVYPRRLETTSDIDTVRLQPPLLAVSAERFKAALWRDLGLAPNLPWSGKIFLDLHAARVSDEDPVIISQPFIRTWNYRLELPDQLSQLRCARAFSTVLLLEIANRSAADRSASVPPWLADGLAREILAQEPGNVFLSTPTNCVNGFAQTRLDEKRSGFDPLADARRVLQNSPALTFDQLSWPPTAQLNCADGGVYLASAQLFVCDLLELKNGAAKLRTLLAQLPACENWQTAFFTAFKDDFLRPLDVEKWWALRVVNFAARDPGPQWTLAVSREKLDAILAVPVGVRYASNALPVRAEVSLQLAVQNFLPPRQTEILQTKRRDLELIQLRLAPPAGALATEYIAALDDFLGTARKSTAARRFKISSVELIKRLDDLDTRRRALADWLDQKVLPKPVP
jgi:hypothetical protein